MEVKVVCLVKRPHCFHVMILICIQDWIWSAGCNPLSITSQGWKLSKFQTDTIARSYILTTLEESIQTVNSAIHLLAMELTCILLVLYSSIYTLKLYYCSSSTCLFIYTNLWPGSYTDTHLRIYKNLLYALYLF